MSKSWDFWDKLREAKALDHMGNFLIQGWELQEIIEKIVSDYKDVTITPCDDDYHSSSIIVLIPRWIAKKENEEYMGTDVLVVPQNGIFGPIKFFLYCGHAVALRNALNQIINLHRFHGDLLDEEMLKDV